MQFEKLKLFFLPIFYFILYLPQTFLLEEQHQLLFHKPPWHV